MYLYCIFIVTTMYFVYVYRFWVLFSTRSDVHFVHYQICINCICIYFCMYMFIILLYIYVTLEIYKINSKYTNTQKIQLHSKNIQIHCKIHNYNLNNKIDTLNWICSKIKFNQNIIRQVYSKYTLNWIILNVEKLSSNKLIKST